MSRKYFGTDGIRGRANGVITAELALRVGQAAGVMFRRGDHRHRVVIGKDTRLSGYMIETAMVAGFISVGMDVLLTGPIPTPAVAMLTRSMRADLGVMISASHNLYDDNGIKLFTPDGFKLSDEMEAETHRTGARLMVAHAEAFRPCLAERRVEHDPVIGAASSDIGGIGAGDERLRRHAPSVDASSPEELPLNHSYLAASLRKTSDERRASLASPNHDCVKMSRHGRPS